MCNNQLYIHQCIAWSLHLYTYPLQQSIKWLKRMPEILCTVCYNGFGTSSLAFLTFPSGTPKLFILEINEWNWFTMFSKYVGLNASSAFFHSWLPCAEYPAFAVVSKTKDLSLTCLTRPSTKSICSHLPAQAFRIVPKTSSHRDISTVNSTCRSERPCSTPWI